MSMLWYLKYKRWRLRRAFAADTKKLEKTKPTRDQINELYLAYHFDFEQAEDAIDERVGRRLFDEARSLDVETPVALEEGMWRKGNDGSMWFSPKGRAHVRKLIDDEKERRFGVKTRWVTRLILPLLAALVGIIGAITGLVAVMQHKK
jgi:hypothetical protein